MQSVPDQPDPPETTHAAIARDARDLRRSLSVNLVGYALKFAVPFLTIVIIRCYGAGPYGVFILAQSILAVLLRLSLLGLDKGLLWWIPRQSAADERVGIGPVLMLTTTMSVALAALTASVLAPEIAAWASHPEIADSLRWMVAGLVPMAMIEVLCQAAIGKRHLEAQVLAKEGVVSLTMVVSALVFYGLGLASAGLGLAFFLSNAAGLFAVFWVFRRAFAGSRGGATPWRLPLALWTYSWPMWLSELASSVFGRLDVFVLAALTSDVEVGIFAGAAQYAQNVASIRGSFDPMVTAIVSQIHHAKDAGRLRRGFAHAWILVASLELPVVAFMVVAAAWVMPILGETYAAGVVPALILIGFYAVHGLFGLNQHIISGFGHSRLVLLNILIAIGVAFGLLFLLIPKFGVAGAALGIGLTYLLLNLIWVAEARVIIGGWHYERSIGAVLLLAAAGAGAMAASWLGLRTVLMASNGADLFSRGVGLLAFMGVFGGGLLALRRSGRLADAPPAEPSGSAPA